MSEEAIARQLVNFEPQFFADPNKIPNFRCGNSKFHVDVWDFKDCTHEIGKSPGYYKLDFKRITKPQIRKVFKQFMVLELLKSFPTAKRDYDALLGFSAYLAEKFPSVESLSQVGDLMVAGYFQHVLDRPSAKTGEPLGRTGLFKATQAVKDLFLEASKQEWDVPADTHYVQRLYRTMIQGSPRAKMPDKKTTKEMFQIETIQRIIACALEDSDIITKASAL